MQVFGLVQPSPGYFWGNDVTSSQFWLFFLDRDVILSHDCHFLQAIAMYELKRTQDVSFQHSAAC